MPYDRKLPDAAPIEELPTTVAALQALLHAERMHTAELVAQQIQASVEQRIEAEVDRRVAAEVACQVEEILERWRLAQHRMFGSSSEANPD